MTTKARSLSLLRLLLLLGLTLGALAFFATRSLATEVSVVATPFVLGIALNVVPFFVRKGADPFEPAAISGLYGAMGLLASFSSILQIGFVDLGPMTNLSPLAKSELAEAVVWSYPIATAAYLAGYYWPGASRFKRVFPRVEGLVWDRTRLVVICGIILAMSLPVAIFFQSRVGTSLTDVTAQAQGKAVWRDDPTQTWILRGIMLSFLPVMLLLAQSAHALRGTRLLAMLGLFGLVGLFSLRVGQRGVFGMLAIECAALVHYLRRRIPLSLVGALIFVGLIGLNVLGEYRAASDPSNVSRVTAAERFNPTSALADHERDRQRLRAMAVTFYYFPDRQDYLYGATWVGLIATPLPRWLWADKTKYFEWRDNAIVYTLVGESTPVPYHGALYANFSWLGVVLGMFFWGAFQKGLYTWLSESPTDKSTVILYASLLLVQSPTLLAIQNNVLQFVLPIYVILLFIGFRRTTRAAVPA